MIDAEKLLGKVLSGAMNSGGKKGRKKKRKNDDMMSSLLGGLTSGKGLITAIGLGVGAYEILKAQKGAAQTTVSSTPPPMGGASVPPPTPPPVPGSAAPPAPPVPLLIQNLQRQHLRSLLQSFFR